MYYAVWDRKTRDLYCVRDRFGEKPFYYGHKGNQFIFGSDLSIFKAFKSFKKIINPEAVSHFLTHGFIAGELSIFQDIYQLLPGHYLKYSFENNSISKENYFDILSLYEKNDLDLNNNSLENNLLVLKNKLVDTVENELISDVNTGTFLSGGIDSSLITAIAQSRSSKSIETFSMGFDESSYDESSHALNISNYLKTKHHNINFSENDAFQLLSKLPTVYSEPFADPSQLPTLFLSQFVSKDLKVVLSGDGGDEIFCGYNRYEFTNKYWKYNNYLPYSVMQFISYLSTNDLIKTLFKINNYPQLDHKIDKLSKTLKAKDLRSLYQGFTSFWDQGEIYKNQHDNTYNFDLIDNMTHLNSTEKLMIADMIFYLPNDILVKVDRASMYNSLEVRSPFLHPDIINLASKLPLKHKFHKGSKKFMLKYLLNEYIPNVKTSRPKQGFSMPLGNWLKNSFRDWAEDLLSSKNLALIEGLDHIKIKNEWKNFLESKNNSENRIWIVLILIDWYKNNISLK